VGIAPPLLKALSSVTGSGSVIRIGHLSLLTTAADPAAEDTSDRRRCLTGWSCSHFGGRLGATEFIGARPAVPRPVQVSGPFRRREWPPRRLAHHSRIDHALCWCDWPELASPDTCIQIVVAVSAWTRIRPRVRLWPSVRMRQCWPSAGKGLGDPGQAAAGIGGGVAGAGPGGRKRHRMGTSARGHRTAPPQKSSARNRRSDFPLEGWEGLRSNR
jgi:hypothetical protein